MFPRGLIKLVVLPQSTHSGIFLGAFPTVFHDFPANCTQAESDFPSDMSLWPETISRGKLTGSDGEKPFLLSPPFTCLLCESFSKAISHRNPPTRSNRAENIPGTKTNVGWFRGSNSSEQIIDPAGGAEGNIHSSINQSAQEVSVVTERFRWLQVWILSGSDLYPPTTHWNTN